MTKIVTQEKIEDVAKCIANGGIAAFPTETVYGLGCDAFNIDAIDKVYKAKGRPSDNPLIVHIANPVDIKNLVAEIPEKAYALMDNFWPGPLTIILPKLPAVPIRVTGGLETIAVRCPSNEIARKLISLSGKFIAAPSANLSGSPSPTAARHVISDLDGRVDYILSGDDSEIGLESTVIDLSDDVPTILRPGAVTQKMMSALIGDVIYDPAILGSTDKPKSPGMKYKHYSPNAPVEVVIGTKNAVAGYIESRCKRENNVGVLTYTENDYDDAKCVLSAGKNMSEYAASLYYNLRVFDEYGVSKIYVEFQEDDDIGIAVKNRLFKAAGGNVTRL